MYTYIILFLICDREELPFHVWPPGWLTLSSRIVVGGSSNQLLPTGTQGGEAGQQFVQLQPLSSVLRQLLPDLLHLRRHGGRLPEPLHRPLQGLQQGVHLIMELRTDGGEEENKLFKRRRRRKRTVWKRGNKGGTTSRSRDRDNEETEVLTSQFSSVRHMTWTSVSIDAPQLHTGGEYLIEIHRWSHVHTTQKKKILCPCCCVCLDHLRSTTRRLKFIF